jgi:hypothetical protein
MQALWSFNDIVGNLQAPVQQQCNGKIPRTGHRSKVVCGAGRPTSMGRTFQMFGVLCNPKDIRRKKTAPPIAGAHDRPIRAHVVRCVGRSVWPGVVEGCVEVRGGELVHLAQVPPSVLLEGLPLHCPGKRGAARPAPPKLSGAWHEAGPAHEFTRSHRSSAHARRYY